MQLIHRFVRYQERVSGVPGRFIAPVVLAGVSLQVAVLGMYWDIGYHIDHGRDQGVFTAPHMFIVAGLQGIVLAALLHGRMGGPAARNERRLPLRLNMSPGGIVMLVCGGVALLGFPLDALWHALFGEDVTLWGPTHLFMIGGAGVSTLGLWMVMRQGFELGRPRKLARRGHLRVAGALIIGLSTFQAEFDFGVPQFQLLYQPVLIAFAAAVALVCARSILGRVGRLPGARDVLRRSASRSRCSSARSRATRRRTSRSTSPRPRSSSWRRSPRRARRCASRCSAGWASGRSASRPSGAGATSGCPIRGRRRCSCPPSCSPWPPALAGSVLGARMSQSLAMPGSERAALPAIAPRAVALAAALALVALFFPLPRTGGDGTRAAIVPTPAGHGRVNVAVTLDPPGAPRATASGSRSSRGRAGRPASCASSPRCARRPGPLRHRPPGARWAATGSRCCASPGART